MLRIEEANSLIGKLLKLKSKAKKTGDKEDIRRFKEYEQVCVDKFKYIVLSKTQRYRNFSNYEDLTQEGLMALLSALHSFNPKRKSNIFWWIHRYTDTRIARCANLHTTIRFPLKYAKHTAPHRESALPLMVDQVSGPHDILEQSEALKTIKKNFVHLSPNQQKVVSMLYGIDGEAPSSISKVCQQLRMSRPTCVKLLDQVFSILRRNIQL
jgi:RNA polymerase sigma factor (sigma-70 family)